jgi:hypothetical protein
LFTDVIEGANVRMIQVGDCSGLSLETLLSLDIT